MAHHITAIITDAAGAVPLGVKAVALGQDLVIVALEKTLCERLGGGTSEVLPDTSELLPDWELVTPSLIERLRALIPSPFAVVETEYFGGEGTQRAGAWHGETTLVAEQESDDAVNLALEALGVTVGSAHDEWAAVGLERFRSNDDLRAAASPTDD